MNNRSLTNLKFAWEVKDLAIYRIDGNWSAEHTDMLKPLGWHTACRVWARRIVAIIRDQGPSETALEAFRHCVAERHTPEKGWHI